MQESAIRLSRRRTGLVMVLGSLLCAAVPGCGAAGDGPPQYHVSGKVTFDGKPVKFGTVHFEPNTQQGNKGPQGFAEIRDGAFDTRNGGKGTVGGALIARITGFDAEPPKDAQDDEPAPQPLFSNFRTEIELPESNATHDIEVTADAAKAQAAAAQRKKNTGP